LSSEQLPYWRSTNPRFRSQPSPTQDAWLLVALVRPSTADDRYDNASVGASPPGAGGTRSGYDQLKSPVCAETCQDELAASEVAVGVPAPSRTVPPAG
jgi:hypothetical protein